MKRTFAIKLAITVMVAATLAVTATNLTCFDAIPTGPCQTAGTWVQTITCQVNCILCPYTARINQICLRTVTRTNRIFASSQYNFTCITGSAYQICETDTFPGCQYEREVLVCEIWPTTKCRPRLIREWVTGPRTGVITPQICAN